MTRRRLHLVLDALKAGDAAQAAGRLISLEWQCFYAKHDYEAGELGFARHRLVERGDVVSFSVPATTLVVFALVAATAGIVSAVLPARRASSLDVVDALGYE